MVDRTGNPIDWPDPPRRNCPAKRKRVSEAVYAARIDACDVCMDEDSAAFDACWGRCGRLGPLIEYEGARCPQERWPANQDGEAERYH
jgi:hypothetical protein